MALGESSRHKWSAASEEGSFVVRAGCRFPSWSGRGGGIASAICYGWAASFVRSPPGRGRGGFRVALRARSPGCSPSATASYSPSPRGEGGVRGNGALSNPNALDSSIASIPPHPNPLPEERESGMPLGTTTTHACSADAENDSPSPRAHLPPNFRIILDGTSSNRVFYCCSVLSLICEK